MKQIWLHLPRWDKKQVTEALEAGVDAILTETEFVPRIRELGRITVAAPSGGDLAVPGDVEVLTITDKTVENRAAQLLCTKTVIVRTTDWSIIPLENLIPCGGDRLLVFVRNADEASVAMEILERGVGGIVLETDDAAEIGRVVARVRTIDQERLDLVPLVVESVITIGMGDRVCVDTCSNLGAGEGLLIGNSSQGLFLVHAENLDNPYVSQRPFRVNAGAVHSYVRVPGDRTRYLGELATGDPVLVAKHQGGTYRAFVGRAKIEKRPLLVVTAAGPDDRRYSVVLQNAETIRLTGFDGTALSVVALRPGDRVMGFVEQGGRHFGMAVDETIVER